MPMTLPSHTSSWIFLAFCFFKLKGVQLFSCSFSCIAWGGPLDDRCIDPAFSIPIQYLGFGYWPISSSDPIPMLNYKLYAPLFGIDWDHLFDNRKIRLDLNITNLVKTKWKDFRSAATWSRRNAQELLPALLFFTHSLLYYAKRTIHIELLTFR